VTTSSHFKILLLLLLMATSSVSVFATDPSFQSKVDSFLKPAMDQDLISGSVLIARRGEILVSKGYGMANREYDIPNTPESKFRLGSISKQFTAAAIMLLEERNLLSMSDPVSRFYPDYPGGDKITIHHLLTHTSGIPNFTGGDAGPEMYVYPHTIDEVINTFKDKPLQFQPGEKWAYTNSGYVLLAGIVEKAANTPFIDFLQSNIFDPLAMKNTGQDSYTAIIKNRAEGHVSFSFDVTRVDYRDLPTMAGAGSLYSTVSDLYLWDQALYSDRLLSRASRDKMFTAQKDAYGYGWFVEDRNGHRALSHRGEISGFIGSIDRYPDDSITVIALFNYESTLARAAIRGLNDLALGREPKPLLVAEPPTIDSTLLASYAGVYQFGEKDSLRVAVDNGSLYVIGLSAQRPVPASPQTAALFFIRGLNSLVKFEADADGKFNSLTLVNSVQVYKAKRVA